MTDQTSNEWQSGDMAAFEALFRQYELAALIVAAFLVGRDARSKGDCWLATMAWAALTLFIFPIGLGLYFLVGRRSQRTC